MIRMSPKMSRLPRSTVPLRHGQYASTTDLVRLVETPKEHAAGALAELGGIEGVAQALNVSVDHGLDSDNTADLAAREKTFVVLCS
ncbi:hypothetical protein H257_02525 [Aphanomyces astaci]|uniref:Uncharacterized protein n=1 Tax=Aphanomyces astaci TaxID=112090 RepID=W4H357_APHAT|nr:hypothetical protein H257_02525 [Aphanomyces astaci]ETV86036.1 hypothetical protein H257_02525 [Aphanomyces astaci]|eukprot:XP_009824508.1 hypothetical protein H257_02525 [Aphanomyces astaci]